MDNKENEKWICVDEAVAKTLADSLEYLKEIAAVLETGFNVVIPITNRCLSSDMSWEDTRLLYAKSLQFIAFFLETFL